MRYPLVKILLLIILISCNTGDQSKDIASTATLIDSTPKTNDTIWLKIQNGQNDYKVTGSINAVKSPVFVKLTNPSSNIIKAQINTAEQSANIRFNQIITADGKADGPFGKELSYELKDAGTVTLVISASKMAENPYIGMFTLTIQLQKK